MKLHVVLDYNEPFDIEDGDVVITSSYRTRAVADSATIIPFNYSAVSEDEEVIKEFNSLFYGINSYFNHVRNTVYAKLFVAIFAIKKIVDKALNENQIEEIVLYEGSKVPFITTSNAEGEGERKRYKTNWLVNALLYKRYKTKYKITWHNKSSALLFVVKNYFRWLRSISLLLCHSYYKSLLSSNIKNDEIKTRFISIVDLPLQAKALTSLLKGSNCLIHYLTFSQVCYEELRRGGSSSSYVPIVGIKRLTLIALSSFFKNLNLSPTGIGRYFDKCFIREIRLQTLIFQLRYRSLINYFSYNSNTRDILLLTNMTWGIDIISANEVAKSLNIKHYNFQYVGMGSVLYPQLELSDCYFLYSKKTYDLYKKYSDTYHLYMPVGKITEQSNSLRKHKVLTIFMQPDSFVYDYFDYINKIIENENVANLGWEIVIKPHYRQNLMDKLAILVEKIPFVRLANPTENCGDLLEITDIALSISSAVIFEAMTNHVMCLIYNPKEKYSKTIYGEDICYPDVNYVIKEPEETICYMEKIASFKTDYENRLSAFIAKNKIEVNVASLLQNALN